MRFWDTSAVVPLLVHEEERGAARTAFQGDPEIVTWWATSIECASALARRQREGVLDSDGLGRALNRLDALAASWQEIEPSVRVRERALRMLRVHPVRAADALQLAAAVTAAEDHPATLPFVTYDDRLAEAAQREGFHVLSPGQPEDSRT